jgi:PAS domain S-box-containing protein
MGELTMFDVNRLRERRRPGQAGQSPMATLKQLTALVVLERLPVPVLAIDRDGTVLFANAIFAAMLGHAPESLQSLKFHEILRTPPLDGACAVSVIRTHAGRLVELVHRDGSTVQAEMSNSAMLRGDDPVALVTFTDLTEQLWVDPQCRRSRCVGSSGVQKSKDTVVQRITLIS